MISPSDDEYKICKKIMLGKSKPNPSVQGFARWISERYGVRVVEVFLDHPSGSRRSRVQIVVRSESEKAALSNDPRPFSSAPHDELVAKAASFFGRSREEFFVVISSFDKVAIEEAYSKISKSDVQKLMRRLANPELWRIENIFGSSFFFFYTMKQAEAAEKSGLREEYVEAYFPVVKKYDKLDCLSKSDMVMKFDSKQNFEENYQGNWFYYYR